MLYTLRFPDYPTAQAAAMQLGFWDTEENTLKVTGQVLKEDGTLDYGWCIDEIGLNPIVPTGEVDENGIEITEQIQGYYVNASGKLPPAVLAFLAPGGYGSAGKVFAGTVAGPHAEPDDT